MSLKLPFVIAALAAERSPNMLDGADALERATRGAEDDAEAAVFAEEPYDLIEHRRRQCFVLAGIVRIVTMSSWC